MDRSVSWWDCGEFIATGYGLQVGHPPGAPFYQLVTHCFMLLSFGNPLWVAPLSNFVSVLCGAFTVLLLYKTIKMLGAKSLGAMVGALCYLFCDTAWFSAVESEVYSMAMLFCSLTVWLMLKWERNGNPRLLLLIGLLLGLGVCVHLMTLLVAPFLLWIYARKLRKDSQFSIPPPLPPLLFAALFFLLGLTPYAIIPIRAATNPPINEGHPATLEEFRAYFNRDQYEKAPLYPRMWREKDSANWEDWTPTTDGFIGNVCYWFTYQFGYMYCRYIMYNFIGRENMRWNLIVVSVLPFLLGIWGMWRHRRRQRGDFHAVLMLFLFGGIILNLYLNHPCYEPRERDYAYVLSFYAFAIWIGIGAASITHRRWRWLLLLAPLTLAVGNWSDHDRHNCHSVHDIALNHLQCCDQGALLVTLGDNDTFPLWYLQYVENQRPDIDVVNINLNGYMATYNLIFSSLGQRPVYFSQYAYDRLGRYFPGRLHCEGFCWQLMSSSTNALTHSHTNAISWHITDHEYIDPISKRFLKIWKENTK
jgi:uncharacterized membrane protein